MSNAFISMPVFCTACLLCHFVHVSGHAYIYWPTSRNYLTAPNDAQSNNFPPNAGAVSPKSGLADYHSQWGAPPAQTRDDPQFDSAWAWDICGGSPNTYAQPLGASRADWGGDPVATYKEGGEIEFIVAVNAEHGGSHEFRLCPKKIDGSMTVLEAATCLDSVFIGRIATPGTCGDTMDSCKDTNPHRDASDPIFKHGPPRHLLHGAHVLKFTLPKGVSCEHCTVQWHWDTAYGEWFRNCMDIAIEAGPTAPAPSPSRRRKDPAPTPSPSRRRRKSTTRRRKSTTRRRKSSRRRRRSSRRRKSSSSRRRKSSSSGTAAAELEYGKVGCFPLAEGDAKADSVELRDSSCTEHKAEHSCRSGLPFFRLLLEKTDAVRACFSFCSSKGADLFGLLGLADASAAQAECRCGATHTNYNFWKTNGLPSGDPHSSLMLDFSTKLSTCTDSSVQVYDYNSWKSLPGSSGVQDAVVDVSADDQRYIESVVLGQQA